MRSRLLPGSPRRKSLTDKTTNWDFVDRPTFSDTTKSSQKQRKLHPNTLRNIVPELDNPKKCQKEGCRAWKKKGQNFCCPSHSSRTWKTDQSTRTQIFRKLRRVNKNRKMILDTRQMYAEALGGSLRDIFDALGENETERINLSSEVDLSKVTLIETTSLVSKILQKENAAPSSKELALSTLRTAIATHMSVVQQYMSIADKSAVATPERMKVFFETIKGALASALITDEGDTDAFDRVWTQIEGIEAPKGQDAPTLKVEIV